MNITKEYLESKNASLYSIDWFMTRTETDARALMLAAVDDGHSDYARWLMQAMITTKEQAVKIAVFAAEQVIDVFEDKQPDDGSPGKAIEAAWAWLYVFEKKYTEDDRPRKAIEAARAWIDNPCEETADARTETQKKILTYACEIIGA